MFNQAADARCSGDNEENCLQVFAANIRIDSAMTRKPPFRHRVEEIYLSIKVTVGSMMMENMVTF